MKTSNPNFLPSGYLLHNRYSIQQSLGQGGFGITYLAYDSKLDQEVCIKELFVSGNSTRGTNLTVHSQTTGGFSFSDFVQRFVQEARQLARFQHPNIVRVIDVFQENDTAYTVMEYVRGDNLKQLIQGQGALIESEVLKIIWQLLDAVEEVHFKGMLHRDIKPENIIVTKEGRLVLIDFGSAREFAEGITTTQTAMLTPSYAPIEQYSTRAKRGPYTDIYSVGATMYYLLTGEKPLPATDRVAEELIAPNRQNQKISTHVSNTVMLAMEMKIEQRFQSILEMRESLKTLQGKPNREKEKEPVLTKNLEAVRKVAQVEKSMSRLFIYLLIVVVLLGSLVYLLQDWQGNRIEYGTFSDIQGNRYKTVEIGEQEWMAVNLNVGRFRNGDLIPEAKTDEEWKRAGENQEAAWSYFNNDPLNGEKFGKLYNWYAVNDSRGLSPIGWHIPSNEEWEKLISFYGGWDKAGGKLKSLKNWKDNGNGTIESGFSGLPGGNRNNNGEFSFFGAHGYWWSSTGGITGYAWYRNLNYLNFAVGKSSGTKEKGFSIRCLRD